MRRYIHWFHHKAKHHYATRHHPHRRFRRRRALIILAILLTLAAIYAYLVSDETVRRITQSVLSSMTGGVAEIDHAQFHLLQGIRLQGLRVYPSGQVHKEDDIILSADDVLMDYHPTALLYGKLRFERIVTQNARLRIIYDYATGSTNLQQMQLTKSKKPSVMPPLILRDATIEYQEIDQKGRSTMLAQQLQGQVVPIPDQKGLCRYELSSRDTGVLQSSQLNGTYDIANGQLTFQGEFLLNRVDLTGLPQWAGPWRHFYRLSQPTGKLTVNGTYRPETGYDLQLNLHDAGLQIPLVSSGFPLSDVNSQLRLTNKGIEIKQLNASYGDVGSFSVDGKIKGYTLDADLALNIQSDQIYIPAAQWNNDTATADINEKQAIQAINDFMLILPSQARMAAWEYRPTGKFRLVVNVNRDAATHGRLHYDGTIDCRDMTLFYRDFPYLLQELNGPIHFSRDKATIGPLITTADNQTIEINSQYNQQDPNSYYLNLSVKAQNLALNKKLKQALPRVLQEQWSRFRPIGVIDADHFWEKNIRDNKKNSLLRCDIDLRDNQLDPVDLDTTLDNIRGHVRWTEGQGITFLIDNAQWLDTTLQASGSADNDGTQLNCVLDFNNLIADPNHYDQMPQILREQIQSFGIQGIISGQTGIKYHGNTLLDKINPDTLIDSLSMTLDATVTNGRLQHQLFPYPLEDVTADVTIQDNSTQIKHLQGKNRNGNVNVTGTLQNSGNYDLAIQGQNLILDNQLRELLSPDVQKLWDTLGLSGDIDVNVQIRQDPNLTRPYFSGKIQPVDCVLAPAKFSRTFEHIHGTIQIQPEQIEIESLTSVDGQGKWVISGLISPQQPDTDPCDLTNSQQSSSTPQLPVPNNQYPRASSANDILNAQHYKYRLNLRGDNLQLKALRGLLPPGSQKNYDALQAQGTLAFELQMHGRDKPDQQSSWSFNGRVTFVDTTLAQPVPIQHLYSELIVDGAYEKKDRAFSWVGDLRPTSMLVNNRPANNITSKLYYDGTTNQLVFQNVNGEFCQGRLAGKATLNFQNTTPGYDIAVTLIDVDLNQYLYPDPNDAAKHQRTQGHLRGDLRLAGQGGIENRKGRFRLAIRDAVLGELPVVVKILALITLSNPDQAAFSEADLQGTIAGRNLFFDPIHLRGRSLKLTGKGQAVQPENKLAIAFGFDPGVLSKMPGLGSFFQNIINPSLVQLWITGTFDNPEVRTVAFPSFEAALDEMLNDQHDNTTPAPAEKQQQ